MAGKQIAKGISATRTKYLKTRLLIFLIKINNLFSTQYDMICFLMYEKVVNADNTSGLVASVLD